MINRPEVAIVGVNRIVERPVARGGSVVLRQVMNLSSSFDHRVVDGHDAARTRWTLGEFEVRDASGRNLAGSHAVNRLFADAVLAEIEGVEATPEEVALRGEQRGGGGGGGGGGQGRDPA